MSMALSTAVVSASMWPFIMKSIACRWLKAGRADLAAVGAVGAVGDEVDAELALRALGRDVHFAGRHVIAFGVELEVMDEGLHRGLHLGPARREHLAVGADRPLRHFVQALADDAPALPDFLAADHEAVVAVAIGPDRNVEVHAVIDFVWLRAADVPRNAGCPDHRAGEAPGDRVVLVDRADVDVALLEDSVVGDQRDGVLENLQAVVEEIADLVQHRRRNVLADAADAVIIGVHARAGHMLVELHDVFAHFEQPQVGRHRADVHDVAAEVEHVVRDAGQLRHHRADVLGADRDLEAEQLFDGEHEAVLHAHRRAVIEAVEVGQRLLVGLVLDQLFGAAVEQADVRIDALDDFAVEFEDQAEELHAPPDAGARN